VTPEDTAPSPAERLTLERKLTELATELEIPGTAAVETHLLRGEPAEEILRLAERVGADLIAAGSHGASYPGQLLPGDVYSKLVHQAKCALLIGPPRGMRPKAQAPLEGYEVPQMVVA
jgi:nucleotide-binding universal stress UspA family protein